MLGEIRLEEHVVLIEVRLRDLRGSDDLALFIMFFDEFLDGVRVDRPTFFQQMFDRRFDGRLAHPCGHVKDSQVLAARTGGAFF